MVLVLQEHQSDQSDQGRNHQQDSVYMGQPVMPYLMLVISLPLLPLLPLLSKIPDFRHGNSHLSVFANIPVYFCLVFQYSTLFPTGVGFFDLFGYCQD